MPGHVDVPELVRRIKKKTGISNAELARRTGIARPMVSRVAHSYRNAGRVYENGIALYEFAKNLDIEIPRR